MADAQATAVHRVLERDELLENVLRHLDPEQLSGATALVCRQWRRVVLNSEAVWRPHLDRELIRLFRGLHLASPGAAPAAISTPEALSLSRLWMACHSRNFLRNPTFSWSVNVAANLLVSSRRPWVVKESGSPVVFENPPRGVRPEAEQCFPPPPLPFASDVRLAERPLHSAVHALQRLVAPEQPGCIATTADWAEIVQVVDLLDELVSRGLTPKQARAVLDTGVSLGFQVMVASHCSRGGTFAVGVMLDDGQGPVPSMQRFVRKASTDFFYSNKRYLPAASGWKRFAHVVHACPPGCRRAVVLLRGRMAGGSGNAYLPGVFLDPRNAERSDVPLGVKFASATMQLLPKHLLPDFGENSTSSTWQRPTAEEDGPAPHAHHHHLAAVVGNNLVAVAH